MKATEPISENPGPPSFSAKRSWGLSFHLVVSVCSLLALLVMVNYLANKHDQRFYLSRAARHKLTPMTERVLGGLTNQVKVVVFFDRREPLFSAVSGLLKEYQMRSPRIDLEFVDYQMPGRAEAVRNQYRMEAEGETSRVIFDSGSTVRTVLSTELSEYGVTPEQQIYRTGFKGEQLFTSALLNVTQTARATAYFSQGHGEHAIEEGDQSYSRFVRLLENNNIQVRTASPWIGPAGIPEDCGLLVLPGPTRPFAAEELEKIEQYLSRGGRLFALFSINARGNSTGLEQLLGKWNVQVGFDWAQDAAQSQSGDQHVIVARQFGSHAIVRPLLRSSVALVAPRSVTAKPAKAGPGIPTVTELLFSSSNGRLLAPVDAERWSVQKEGVIPLAAAGERAAPKEAKPGAGSARFVVVGDSIFLSNVVFSQAANADFANQIVNWLMNRDHLLNEIGPRPVSEHQMNLTVGQMRQIRWLLLAALPGAASAIGFAVWLKRRF